MPGEDQNDYKIDQALSQIEELKSRLDELEDAQNNQPPPLDADGDGFPDELEIIRPGFAIERLGPGGADQVKVHPGYAIDVNGVTLYSSFVVSLVETTYFYARYKRSKPNQGWEKAGPNVVLYDSALPTWDEDYVLHPIAKVEWSTTTGSVAEITQYHAGNLNAHDNLAPKIRIWWPITDTIPDGWEEDDTMPGYYPVGYTGAGDYDTIGATLGFAEHGGSTNNHTDHNLAHSHTLKMSPVADLIPNTGEEGACASSAFTGTTTECDVGGGGGGITWCDEDGEEAAAHHSVTDNRPPSIVGRWLKRKGT